MELQGPVKIELRKGADLNWARRNLSRELYLLFGQSVSLFSLPRLFHQVCLLHFENNTRLRCQVAHLSSRNKSVSLPDEQRFDAVLHTDCNQRTSSRSYSGNISSCKVQWVWWLCCKLCFVRSCCSTQNTPSFPGRTSTAARTLRTP